jgi:membrane protease subunit HflK
LPSLFFPVTRAEGEAVRFLSVYKEFAVVREVTTRRIYIETME